jgi:hypothetical protein
MPTAKNFQCQRCGLPVHEATGLCTDCSDVLNDLGEKPRWASDYSRMERRALGSRIQADRNGWIATSGDLAVPRRDRIQRHEPLDLTAYDYPLWLEAAWDAMDELRAMELPPGTVIQHDLTPQQWRNYFCKRSHPLTPANTYIDAKGARRCRACANEGKRRKRAQAAQRREQVAS